VGRSVSCGACCGLYNLPDPSRDRLQTLLQNRTEAFGRLPREEEAILAFGEAEEKALPRKRPYADFHHCPFLGLSGESRSRVGCLLHPLAEGNGGVDYRGLSFYGGLACRTYFCPTHRRLSAPVKRILREAATDWYAYGLLITEADLLEAFFTEVEARLGTPLPEALEEAGEPHREGLRDLFGLKIDWPFRSGLAGLCHYFFDDRLHPKPVPDWDRLGIPPPRYARLLVELGSRFSAGGEVRRAEAILEVRIGRVAAALDPILDRKKGGSRNGENPTVLSEVSEK